MKVVKLAFAYLADRPLGAALNVLLLALGVGTVTALILVSGQMQSRLARDGAGIDLVVGAKGSPLQLILSALYHVDVPTGNVPLSLAEELEAERFISKAMPVSLGDSLRGYRIVGATHAYPRHFGAEVAAGTVWDGPLQATIGARVASEGGVALGDRFVSSHGMSEGGGAHEHATFEVVGVLEPTGTVLDRLVLVSLDSVWIAHGQAPVPAEEHDHAEEGADARAGDDLEVTAVLVVYRSPMAAATVPRRINTQTPYMAAAPAVETTRLLSLVGSGLDVMRGFAWVLIATSGLGVFVTLATAMRERRADIALMRVMGASRSRVFAQVVLEGLIVAALGAGLGFTLGHGAVEIFAHISEKAGEAGVTGLTAAPVEVAIFFAALAVGAAGALAPAALAYRVDIVRTLSR
jgi:putative ABC transport system permease protein